jgi:hypothetical protein
VQIKVRFGGDELDWDTGIINMPPMHWSARTLEDLWTAIDALVESSTGYDTSDPQILRRLSFEFPTRGLVAPPDETPVRSQEEFTGAWFFLAERGWVGKFIARYEYIIEDVYIPGPSEAATGV